MFHRLPSRLGGLAACLAAGLVAAPLTFAPSPAEAASCGALNQRTCTVFERPGKPCNAGLRMTSAVGGKCVKPRKKPPSKPKPRCGGLNQNACTVLQRPGKPCNAGLALTRAIGGKCVAKGFDGKRALASGRRQIDAAKAVAACMARPERKARFKKLVDRRATAEASRIVERECLPAQRRADLRRPMDAGDGNAKRFRILTIGLGAGVQVVGAGGVESGVAIDLDGKKKARFYTVAALGAGIGVGIGADLLVSLSRDAMPSQKKVYKGTSFTSAGKVFAGGSLTFNFDGYHSRHFGGSIKTPAEYFDGLSVGVGVGAAVAVDSGAHQLTTIW